MAFSVSRRNQILMDFLGKVVTNTNLTDANVGSILRQILDASATGDEELYYEMQQLKNLWNIQTATGTDLDSRAADYNPLEISRLGEVKATGNVQFVPDPSPAASELTIDIGTQVMQPATSSTDEIIFVTTEEGTILNGGTTSGNVAVEAFVAGTDGNVIAGKIIEFKSAIPTGVGTVNNSAATANGRGEETDEAFRRRIQAYVSSLSMGVKYALEDAALGTQVDNGQRCEFAKAFTRLSAPGTVDLYIDDGNSTAETTTAVSGEDLIVAPPGWVAETELYTEFYPIKEGTYTVYYGAAAKVENVDYYIDPTEGYIQFIINPAGGEAVTIDYTYFTNLIQEVQYLINGKESDRENYPGVKAAGDRVYVKAPTAQTVNVTIGAISVEDTYTIAGVSTPVETAITNYINGLDIGEDVVLNEIRKVIMSVDGVYDINITAPTANVAVLQYQLATVGTITLP